MRLFKKKIGGNLGSKTQMPFDKDYPWILNFNPLFEKFGFKVWWEYEYVGSVLTKSETHWKKVGDDPNF